MGRCLQRLLGPVRALDAGQYTVETVSGDPAIACPECGEVDEVETSRVLDGGRVRYIWACPSERCAFKDFITLESWGEAVLS